MMFRFFLTYCPDLYVPSSVFAPCNRVISPSEYLHTCELNNCEVCSTLEAYATACSDAGVCIDWRNATNGQCGEIYSQ